MVQDSDVKISKRSFISLEIFIMAIVTTASLILVWANLNDSLQEAKSGNLVLASRMSAVESRFESMNKTLGEMLVEARIQNELARAKVQDRWTAGMETELTKRMFELMRKLHPELRASDCPDIREIQKRFGLSE